MTSPIGDVGSERVNPSYYNDLERKKSRQKSQVVTLHHAKTFAILKQISRYQAKHTYIYTPMALPAMKNKKTACGKYFSMNATGHMTEKLTLILRICRFNLNIRIEVHFFRASQHLHMSSVLSFNQCKQKKCTLIHK